MHAQPNLSLNEEASLPCQTCGGGGIFNLKICKIIVGRMVNKEIIVRSVVCEAHYLWQAAAIATDDLVASRRKYLYNLIKCLEEMLDKWLERNDSQPLSWSGITAAIQNVFNQPSETKRRMSNKQEEGMISRLQMVCPQMIRMYNPHELWMFDLLNKLSLEACGTLTSNLAIVEQTMSVVEDKTFSLSCEALKWLCSNQLMKYYHQFITFHWYKTFSRFLMVPNSINPPEKHELVEICKEREPSAIQLTQQSSFKTSTATSNRNHLSTSKGMICIV